MAFAAAADWDKSVRIQREGPTIVHPPIEEWQWRPSRSDVAAYFDNMLPAPPELDGFSNDPGPWSIDFEATIDRRVVCLGIWSCYEPTKHQGICIPFLSQGGANYWSASDEARVFDMVSAFFTDPSRPKIGQNAVGYDTGYPPFNQRSLIKEAWGINVRGILGDCMVGHHCCFSELKHSLAFQASIATDLPPYKEELWDSDVDEEDDSEDDWTRILDRPDEKVRVYNLRDAFAQAVIWNGLVLEMAP